jgi:hypothetical protein
MASTRIQYTVWGVLKPKKGADTESDYDEVKRNALCSCSLKKSHPHLHICHDSGTSCDE